MDAPVVEVATVDVSDEPAREVRGYVVPVVSLDSDDGFGVGLRGELSRDRAGHDPYLDAWMAHVHVTWNGFQHHRVRYDRTGVDGSWRLTAYLAYRAWKNDGYYGVGVDSELPSLDAAPTAARYALTQPFGRLTLRRRVVGELEAFGAIEAKLSDVDAYPGSRLASDSPHGMDGGPAAYATAGLLVDRRQPETTPDRGFLAEGSVRYGARFPTIAPRGTMWGLNGQIRAYQPVASGVTVAGRLVGELVRGDVPFYEMGFFGGLAPIAGLGGVDTVRGVPFDRYRVPGRAVANLELRVDAWSGQIGGAPLRLQGVPAVDGAWLWEPGDARVVPSGAIGARAIFDTDFVGRVDLGVAPDRRLVSGASKQIWTYGFYLAFDHMF